MSSGADELSSPSVHHRPQPMRPGAGEPRRRRRALRGTVSLVVVAALIAAAGWAAEWLARDIVERTIRTQVVEQLGLPAEQQIDVDIDGLVLPQLIAGTLDDVRVASQDVAFSFFAGDVEVVARGVPIRGDGDLAAASATVSMDEGQLRTLLGAVDGFPADTVGIEAPVVTATIDLALFGASFSIGVGFGASAVDGDIALAPASLRLGEATMTADDLRRQFGSAADAVLQSWDVCVAEYLPAALTLENVTVASGRVVAGLDIAPGVLHDEALRRNGTCD